MFNKCTVSRLRGVKNASCLRKVLQNWAGTLLQVHNSQAANLSDSVHPFEDRDNPTSQVFIEVLEGFIDASFTKKSASIWDRQGRRSVFATGGVSMAATGMPNFVASFAEAAYKRDLLNRLAL
jgi:hypothetical protein